MTSPAPQLPFWKRKRRFAAAVLWLVLAYPLSVGLLVYAHWRAWTPKWSDDLLDAYAHPLWLLENADLPPSRFVKAHRVWWVELARQHNGGALRF